MAGASPSPRKELRNAGSGAPEARIVREEGRCRITIIRWTDETRLLGRGGCAQEVRSIMERAPPSQQAELSRSAWRVRPTPGTEPMQARPSGFHGQALTRRSRAL